MNETYVVVGKKHWGKGGSLKAAKANLRRQGGLLTLGYQIVVFGPQSRVQGVSAMNVIRYEGPDPLSTAIVRAR